MKILKRMILKEENQILNDSEMKKVLGGTFGWDPRCSTTCPDNNGNVRVIKIEHCSNCYVDDNNSVSCMDFNPNNPDTHVTILRCSDSLIP